MADRGQRTIVEDVQRYMDVFEAPATFIRPSVEILIDRLTEALQEWIFSDKARSVLGLTAALVAAVLVLSCLRGFMQDAELSLVNPQIFPGPGATSSAAAHHQQETNTSMNQPPYPCKIGISHQLPNQIHFHRDCPLKKNTPPKPINPGYTINSRKYTPNNTNLEAILKLNRPCNNKILQRILGTINIYNKFIPHYAQIRAPLNEVLLKIAPWFWTAKHEQTFQQPVLYIDDPSKPCHLFTNASGLGVTGVLEQPDEQGNLHPIGYFSRRLHSYEQNYSDSEIETLAIINSVQRFHTYLHNIHFTLHTNHLPLKWIKSVKNPHAFLSIKFKQFLNRNNVKHLLTSAHHPETNTKVERLNSTIINRLIYKETVHTITGFIPWFLYYGIQPQYIEHDTEVHTPIEKAKKLAIERTIKFH
ncbi:K02A2.6-like [Cordylochernes scorpioides]|uniref:K02A2.6-like n=1 Tax=Cordylochernes scorpioides TaxID=51811 RepID=A0ABY6L8G7_9ARAC|nr:K02A2.6-like [Cordylochernes scorpioides]